MMMSDTEYYATTVDVVLEMVEGMPVDALQLLVKSLQRRMLQKLMEEEDR